MGYIRFLLPCVLALSTVGQNAAFAQDSDTATTVDEQQAAFQTWLSDLKKEATDKGFAPELVEQALGTVKYVPKVIKKDRSQPEVVQTYAAYLKARVSEWRTNKGREMMAGEAGQLALAAEKYGVQPRFIAAIWGMETNYGTYKLTHNIFEALATLAYDPRRGARFRREIFDALTIVSEGYASFDEMRSSWAGAMGQPQFMPASYLRFAQDMDGDGRKDIWNNHGDVFASIGAYLKHYGWRNDQTWGRLVKLPEGGESTLKASQDAGLAPEGTCKSFKSMGAWRNLSDWQELGVRRANGADLPTRDLQAALIVADKGDDMGYLVYRNFCSIMRYNPAFKYALGVSLLSDKISRPE